MTGLGKNERTRVNYTIWRYLAGGRRGFILPRPPKEVYDELEKIYEEHGGGCWFADLSNDIIYDWLKKDYPTIEKIDWEDIEEFNKPLLTTRFVFKKQS